MSGTRLVGLWLVSIALGAPVAQAQPRYPVLPIDAPAGASPAPHSAPAAAPASVGTADVRQILLRNRVRFCGFFQKENASTVVVRDAYGNSRSIPRSEIAQMLSGSRAWKSCERHLVLPASPSGPNASPAAMSAGSGGKDGWVALSLSIGVPLGTGLIGASLFDSDSVYSKATGGVLIVGALTVGPSAGHMYTGEFLRVAGFSLLRVVALGTTFTGICPGGCKGTALVPALGGVSWLALTLYDIADSPMSAQRVNMKAGISLAPMLQQERGRDLRPVVYSGLRLAMPL